MTQDRRPPPTPKVPLLVPGDAAIAMTEPVHALFARVLPASANLRTLARLARLATSIRPEKKRQFEQMAEDLLGPAMQQLPRRADYVRDLIAAQLCQRMYYARLEKDAGWRPDMVVEGAASVEDALQAGRGVVFWMQPQELIALLLRMACFDRGWPLYNLAHWMHGQSVSRAGIATFNRRDCRIEDSLTDRIIMTETTVPDAIARCIGRLKSGRCVAVLAVGQTHRPACFPFFDGHIQLAMGAPVMARRAKAALFSVAVRGNLARPRLIFEELPAPRTRPLEDIGRDFVSRFEDSVLEAPQFWPARAPHWGPGDPRATGLPDAVQ